MSNEDRIAKLERELAELKAKAEPQEKKPFKSKASFHYDPTEGMGMPPSAVRAMCAVVPDMRGIAQEQKQVSMPSGFGTTAKPGKPVERGNGWGKSVPLGPPSGIKYVDQIADHFDQLDKLETIKKVADAVNAAKGK